MIEYACLQYKIPTHHIFSTVLQALTKWAAAERSLST